ncbi:MAG: hypothetical protein WC998_02210 [Candidatus Paceibacterota bacterium]|jgi:hypothetical protein
MINFTAKVATTTAGRIKIIKYLSGTPSIDYPGTIKKIKALLGETILKAEPAEVQEIFNVLKGWQGASKFPKRIINDLILFALMNSQNRSKYISKTG